MANFPVQSTTGDPIFRAQNSSINSIRNFSRIQADASVKLNSQERIVSPGDDALSFSTSRKIRSEIGALRVVQETGQLNITGLGLALEGLDSVKTQLDSIKKALVQSQVADQNDVADIQSQIDLALKQIDSTAKNTKLGSRSLLDGSSQIKAFASINQSGETTDFAIRNAGQSLTQTSGIQNVKVNKIGVGGPVKLLNDGRSALSLNFQILSGSKASKAFVQVQDNGGGTGEFVELRVTGKLGSQTIRLNSNFAAGLAGLGGGAESFNRLAQETGVVLVSSNGGNGWGFSTVGFGADEFVKIEVLSGSATAADYNLIFNGAATTIDAANAPAGTTITEYGTAAKARINGTEVELGGQYGTTARYLVNGYDVEIDFGTLNLAGGSTNATTNQGADNVTITGSINIDLTQGVTGILGTSGNSGDILQYSVGNFTTESLGRGTALYTVTTVSSDGAAGGGAVSTVANDAFGNEIIGQYSVADLSSSGRLALDSGNVQAALRTIDRAVSQVIGEQTRLGSIQGNFIDAVSRAEIGIGNFSSADADIIGVDAATEITNLVQAGLGVSTASSVLAQANNIQQTIFSLLR